MSIALFGRADGAVLEVDEVVAALLGALGAVLEAGHEPGEREVQVGRLLGLAADDQRRAGLVDEDVVDLVDDREAALALHALVEFEDHVVAQVVEAELVVRAVGDVGCVGLAPGHRSQVEQPLVGRRVARLEDERRVVRDHPDADAEEVEDRAHPLRVASGEVVVDGHDVHAAAGQRVEDRGERADERLALAGPHLGDLALVEDGRPDELDVEVAHAERPLHRLAGHREDLGQDVVERLLEALVLALAALLGELAAALEVVVVELVVGRLVRLGARADLVADLRELGADLLVGQRLEFGLERVGLVDQGLDASELAVVRVDETGKESHGTVSIGASPRPGPARGHESTAAGSACRARRSVPEPRAVAHHEEHERQRGEAEPEQHGHQHRGRVHLRVLELGQALCGAAGAPARRAELVAPVPFGDRTRLEAALAVGSVELEAHRSPAGAARPSRLEGSPSTGGCPSPRRLEPSPPSSQSSISWVNETSLENSAPTDSPRWMRLMASPMSGATDSVVIFGSRLRGGQRDRVGDDDLAQVEVADALDGRVAQDAVRRAGVDLGHALALERADDLDERAGRVDLVVDDDRALALDVADDVHQLGPVEVADAPLLDDRQRRVEQLGERPRALGEAEVGHDHDVSRCLSMK